MSRSMGHLFVFTSQHSILAATTRRDTIAPLWGRDCISGCTWDRAASRQAGLRLAQRDVYGCQADKGELAMVESRRAWRAGATLISGLCRRTLPQRGQATAHQRGAWTEHTSRASCTLSLLEVGPLCPRCGNSRLPSLCSLRLAPPCTLAEPAADRQESSPQLPRLRGFRRGLSHAASNPGPTGRRGPAAGLRLLGSRGHFSHAPRPPLQTDLHSVDVVQSWLLVAFCPSASRHHLRSALHTAALHHACDVILLCTDSKIPFFRNFSKTSNLLKSPGKVWVKREPDSLKSEDVDICFILTKYLAV